MPAKTAPAPDDRLNLSLSFVNSLIIHALIVMLIALMTPYLALRTPTDLAITIVGLEPVPRVNLGQVAPRVSAPVTAPADKPDRSAPVVSEEPQPLDASPPVAEEDVVPVEPVLTIDNPDLFVIPSSEREVYRAERETTRLRDRTENDMAATAPRQGNSGMYLPEHREHSLAISAAPTGQVALPPFVESSTPIDATIVATNPAVSLGSRQAGTVVSDRRPIAQPLPDYPEKYRQRGVEPEVQYKILINSIGDVEEVSIYHHSGYPELDREVMAHIWDWRYQPGVGSEWRIVKVTFELAAE